MQMMEKRGELPGLSRREAEALEHVVNGKTNEEVSMLMGISKRTVEKHLERVYKKLGVESRTAAVLSFFNNKDVSHGDTEIIICNHGGGHYGA